MVRMYLIRLLISILYGFGQLLLNLGKLKIHIPLSKDVTEITGWKLEMNIEVNAYLYMCTNDIFTYLLPYKISKETNRSMINIHLSLE